MSPVSAIPSSRAFGVMGISGVGKTSLISRAVQGLDGFLHVQASALIKAGLEDPSLSSEALGRLGGDKIIENQLVLVRMFESVRVSNPDRLAVLDAHSVIDTGQKIIPIPVEIIRDLRLERLIFVRDLPENIANRRKHDRDRTRPNRTLEEIGYLQDQALTQCQEHACRLRLPLNLISGGDEFGLALALQQPSHCVVGKKNGCLGSVSHAGRRNH